MKRRVILLSLLLLVSLCLLLVGCRKTGEDENVESAVYYTVTYDTNGAGAIEPRQVPAGGLLPDPGVPQREGYLFGGWTHDGGSVTFGMTLVKGDMVVRANWISAESMFGYTHVEGTDTAIITELKGEMAELRIPTSIGNYRVVGLGDHLFAGLESEKIKKIFVPHTVTSIGEETFAEVTSIAIEFDERCQITSLGERAFFGCVGLTDIPLGEGLTLLPYEVLAGTSLKSLRLPKSVTKIDENALDACGSLVAVMMHSSVESVENAAFFECDALKTLFFYGSAEQADALMGSKVDSMNDSLKSAKIYLYAEAKPSVEGKYEYFYLDENQKTKIW